MSIANQRKRILGVALVSALLLLVPAVAMRLTPEVSWGPGDFAAAAALLFGAGTLAVFGLSRIRGKGWRAALVVAVAFTAALVWAELAVGLFS